MTLQLRWNVDPDLMPNAEPQHDQCQASIAEETYHLYVTQLYNAVWKLGEDMGSSELLTR